GATRNELLPCSVGSRADEPTPAQLKRYSAAFPLSPHGAGTASIAAPPTRICLRLCRTGHEDGLAIRGVLAVMRCALSHLQRHCPDRQRTHGKTPSGMTAAPEASPAGTRSGAELTGTRIDRRRPIPKAQVDPMRGISARQYFPLPTRRQRHTGPSGRVYYHRL